MLFDFLVGVSSPEGSRALRFRVARFAAGVGRASCIAFGTSEVGAEGMPGGVSLPVVPLSTVSTAPGWGNGAFRLILRLDTH